MDGTKVRDKLIGSEDERAVSPVIGVILMVAITVILAAVIAAFVLDIGPGSGPVNAAVSADADSSEVTFTVDTTGDAERIEVRGDDVEDGAVVIFDEEDFSTGATNSTDDFNSEDSGSANIVAIDGSDESVIGDFEWDFDP